MAEKYAFGREVQSVAKTTPSPSLTNEAQLSTNYLYSSIVIFRIIQYKISNLILNLIGFDNVKDFSRDVCSCVLTLSSGTPIVTLYGLLFSSLKKQNTPYKAWFSDLQPLNKM
jgi:hypothetical protein